MGSYEQLYFNVGVCEIARDRDRTCYRSTSIHAMKRQCCTTDSFFLCAVTQRRNPPDGIPPQTQHAKLPGCGGLLKTSRLVNLEEVERIDIFITFENSP